MVIYYNNYAFLIINLLFAICYLQFTIYNLQFSVQLQNQALGTIIGKGIINDKLIGWEFRMPEMGFEGFEFYEMQSEESYMMHAEYATSDEFRTTIRGKIWRSRGVDGWAVWLPPTRQCFCRGRHTSG